MLSMAYHLVQVVVNARIGSMLCRLKSDQEDSPDAVTDMFHVFQLDVFALLDLGAIPS